MRLFSLRGGGVGGVAVVQMLHQSPLLKTTQKSKEKKTAATYSRNMWAKKKKVEFESVFGDVRCSVQLDGTAVLTNFLTLLFLTRPH